MIRKRVVLKLRGALNSLIRVGQSEFLIGENISEKIRLFEELMEYCGNNEESGILFFVDFEQAFDKLDHEYLRHSLQFYGIAPEIQRWIHILYEDALACTVHNGTLSPDFPVRQDCPLGPYLFVLAVEPLATLLDMTPM